MGKTIRIKVPASTSNLGSGFDTLGLALELVNEIEISISGKSLSVEIEGEGAQELPKNGSNLFVQAMDLGFKSCGKTRPKGLQVRMVNHIPLARGLGSSASAIIGGLLAAQKISHKSLSDQEVLQLALKLEEHPDNLVPALVGGLSLSILEGREVVFLALPIPVGLQVVMTIPEFKLSTKKARAVLPKKVPFRDAVFNLGRSSFLTAALVAGRYDLLKLAVKDRLHQPYRFVLTPKMKKVFDLASEAGGCGTVVSGSGPSILTFLNHHDVPSDLVKALTEQLDHQKIQAQVKVLNISRQGAVVEEV
ncbi:MAG: homoserine kinase [Chlamydiae bacterium]|nr:homoserine kinase [Chlamydiota bacterium]MBI3277316.1 homoserine kinase [Chlamydiota bacterium]